MQVLEADKIGSATSSLNLTKTVAVISENNQPKAGDVVVVRALSESAKRLMSRFSLCRTVRR